MYTWYDFVPKNLFSQFRKLANFYFLLITFMQTIRHISITNGQPVMAMPLAIVVVVQMLKDGYEDIMRHKDDKKENYSPA